MMRSLLAGADTANTVSEVIKKLLVLDAINWINLAVKDIKTSTVEQCFVKAEFLPELIYEEGKKNYLHPTVSPMHIYALTGIYP